MRISVAHSYGWAARGANPVPVPYPGSLGAGLARGKAPPPESLLGPTMRPEVDTGTEFESDEQ